ncbi:MAG: hypothetical protein ACO3JH_02620 [Flavobacteriaceae bacterium]
MAIKKKQPEPPKKKYTAKDSAQLVGTMSRLDENVFKAKRKNFESPSQNYQIRQQLDSIQKNPYSKTYFEREAAKPGSGGRVKRESTYSKPLSGQTLKATPTPKLKNPHGTVKAPAKSVLMKEPAKPTAKKKGR